MTDIGDGIHLSTAATRSWEPDLDVGGQGHLVLDDGVTTAGLWRAEPGVPPAPAAPVTIPRRETIYVVSGRVRIGVDDRDTFDLGPGDMISIPAGAAVGWDATADCEVFWVYA